MDKLYKIQHIPTGKFIRIKLEKEGIKTPPNPSNKEFAKINCKIVIYTIELKKINNITPIKITY